MRTQFSSEGKGDATGMKPKSSEHCHQRTITFDPSFEPNPTMKSKPYEYSPARTKTFDQTFEPDPSTGLKPKPYEHCHARTITFDPLSEQKTAASGVNTTSGVNTLSSGYTHYGFPAHEGRRRWCGEHMYCGIGSLVKRFIRPYSFLAISAPNASILNEMRGSVDVYTLRFNLRSDNVKYNAWVAHRCRFTSFLFSLLYLVFDSLALACSYKHVPFNPSAGWSRTCLSLVCVKLAIDLFFVIVCASKLNDSMFRILAIYIHGVILLFTGVITIILFQAVEYTHAAVLWIRCHAGIAVFIYSTSAAFTMPFSFPVNMVINFFLEVYFIVVTKLQFRPLEHDRFYHLYVLAMLYPFVSIHNKYVTESSNREIFFVWTLLQSKYESLKNKIRQDTAKGTTTIETLLSELEMASTLVRGAIDVQPSKVQNSLLEAEERMQLCMVLVTSANNLYAANVSSPVGALVEDYLYGYGVRIPHESTNRTARPSFMTEAAVRFPSGISHQDSLSIYRQTASRCTSWVEDSSPESLLGDQPLSNLDELGEQGEAENMPPSDQNKDGGVSPPFKGRSSMTTDKDGTLLVPLTTRSSLFTDCSAFQRTEEHNVPYKTKRSKTFHRVEIRQQPQSDLKHRHSGSPRNGRRTMLSKSDYYDSGKRMTMTTNNDQSSWLQFSTLDFLDVRFPRFRRIWRKTRQLNLQHGDIEARIQKLDSEQRFDVGTDWNLNTLKIPTPVLTVGYSLLKPCLKADALRCSKQQLFTFLYVVQKLYVSSNTYHHSGHGAMVANSAACLYRKIFFNPPRINTIDYAVLIVAALAHDVGHPGRMNSFLINSSNPVATVYNDKAVLENYHSALTFKVLAKPECDIFAEVSEAQYRSYRSSIIDYILATDMTQHFEIISQFKIRKKSPEFDCSIQADASLLGKMIIKAGDISHGTVEWRLHKLWSLRCSHEFWQQGDQEASMGLQRSALCCRGTQTELATAQKGFLKVVLQPLFEQLTEPSRISCELSHVITEAIADNVRAWDAVLSKEITVDLDEPIESLDDDESSADGTEYHFVRPPPVEKAEDDCVRRKSIATVPVCSTGKEVSRSHTMHPFV